MSSLYILSFLYKHFIFALPCKEESMNINISQWIFYCTKLIALSAYMLSLQLLCLDRTSFLSAFEILKSILEKKDASAGLHRIRKEMLRLLIKSQSKGKLCTGSKKLHHPEETGGSLDWTLCCLRGMDCHIHSNALALLLYLSLFWREIWGLLPTLFQVVIQRKYPKSCPWVSAATLSAFMWGGGRPI